MTGTSVLIADEMYAEIEIYSFIMFIAVSIYQPVRNPRTHINTIR